MFASRTTKAGRLAPAQLLFAEQAPRRAQLLFAEQAPTGLPAQLRSGPWVAPRTRAELLLPLGCSLREQPSQQLTKSWRVPLRPTEASLLGWPEQARRPTVCTGAARLVRKPRRLQTGPSFVNGLGYSSARKTSPEGRCSLREQAYV